MRGDYDSVDTVPWYVGLGYVGVGMGGEPYDDGWVCKGGTGARCALYE